MPKWTPLLWDRLPAPFPLHGPAVGGDGGAVDPPTQGGSLSTALKYVSRDVRHCASKRAYLQQNLSLDLLKKMATSLAHSKTLKRLELRSDSLTQYNDAKLFTQHLMLGAAGSTTLTEVCIGFSSWRRDCHIQSGHVAGSVQKVTMCGAPLDVLCDLLPVFEPVEQLVCLNIKDPQEQSTPELFFSPCISSRLKGAARSKRITSVQLAHSEEHQQHVEVVLTYLFTDLSVEERRIGKGQCTLESGLVCSCVEVLPVACNGRTRQRWLVRWVCSDDHATDDGSGD